MRSDRRAGEHLLLAGTLLGTGLILVLTASLFVSGLGRFRGDDAAQVAAPTSAPVPTAPPPLAELTPMASPTALPAAPATPVIAAGDGPLVCLDVGHGGIDWGNVRLSEDETEILTYEKDLVLAQSLDLEARLKKRGIGVVLTRRTDSEVNAANQDINGDGEVGEDVNGDGRIDPEQGETVSNLDELQARVNMCNDAGADLLMSVHVNGAANTFLNGYETWWVKDRPISDQSRRFAELVAESMGVAFEAAGFETTFRGAADDTQLYLPDEDQGTFDHYVMLSPDVPTRNFVGSKMPGIVVEGLFLSNDDDYAFVTTEAGQDAIVSAYEQAIVDYFASGDTAPVSVAALVASAPQTRSTLVGTPAVGADDPSPTPRPSPPANPDPTTSQILQRGQSGRKEVALTFDAGADRGDAEQILDTLKQYDVKASFGMTGAWAEANPDLVKRMADEGHQIFNHTWSHRSFTGASPNTDPLTYEERLKEIEDTEEIIREVTGGYDTRPYFRPPYGDYDASVLSDLADAGYTATVMWTCDSFGWKGWTAAEIVQYCGTNPEPGDNILMHVGQDSQDYAALPAMIESFRAAGFTCVTVEQLYQP